MAAVAGLTGLLAHGGLGGAIVESLLVLAIAGVFVGLWLRDRRLRRAEQDQIKPQ